MGKFQIFKSSKNDQFYFHLKAGNGEIILSSEGYTTKQGCKNGIESVKGNAPYDSRYVRKDNPANYSFTLKATNGETIGKSESYATAQGREKGIESVKNNAPDAGIEDLA